MVQTILPLFSKETTLITAIVGYEKRNGMVYYFIGQVPMSSHEEKDIEAFKYTTSQLVVSGHAKQMDIVRAFGVTKISVKRSVKKLRDKGTSGFFTKEKRQRKAHVLTAEVIKKVQNMLNEEKDIKAISQELKLKLNTLEKAIQTGTIKKKQKPTT